MTDHMSPDEFRRHGREVIDWITEYMERVEELPVKARVEPGEIRQRLPPSPPLEGEPFAALLQDVDDVVLPGITQGIGNSFCRLSVPRGPESPSTRRAPDFEETERPG